MKVFPLVISSSINHLFLKSGLEAYLIRGVYMAPRPHQAMIIVMNLGANKTQVEKLVVFFMNAENHK